MDLESIVERCQSGDRDAFEIIYRMYLLPMHEVVSHYVNSRDAVWDILHDGFIIAFQSIKSLKTPSKIKAWLTTIMKNLALQFIVNNQLYTQGFFSEIKAFAEMVEFGGKNVSTLSDMRTTYTILEFLKS